MCGISYWGGRMADLYEWDEMPHVTSVFQDKVKEIEDYLDLLDKLLNRYAQIEYRDRDGKSLHKLDFKKTHPFKSGAILMIYNFMESVGTELMNDIYDHVKSNIADKSLENLHDKLCKTITGHACRNNLFIRYLPNYRYTQNNLDSLIISGWLEKLLEEKTDKNGEGDIYYKWFNGNVDVREIRKCLTDYGFVEDVVSNLVKDKPWPKSLLEIKRDRNRLAHGGITFTNLGRDKNLDTIKRDFEHVKTFFVELLGLINIFLKNKEYLKSSNQLLSPI